jgi:tRNA (guanine26-N2/guanine27-N2)-dimethyltransferase
MNYSGPLWLGELWDDRIVEAMVLTASRLRLGKGPEALKILEKIRVELKVSTPTYYRVDRLAEKLNVQPLSPKRLVKEVEARGFNASLTHFNPQGVRTNAPVTVLAEILGKS